MIELVGDDLVERAVGVLYDNLKELTVQNLVYGSISEEIISLLDSFLPIIKRMRMSEVFLDQVYRAEFLQVIYEGLLLLDHYYQVHGEDLEKDTDKFNSWNDRLNLQLDLYTLQFFYVTMATDNREEIVRGKQYQSATYEAAFAVRLDDPFKKLKNRMFEVNAMGTFGLSSCPRLPLPDNTPEGKETCIMQTKKRQSPQAINDRRLRRKVFMYSLLTLGSTVACGATHSGEKSSLDSIAASRIQDRIYVAVGSSYTKNMSNLMWALRNSDGKKGVGIIHVHQPAQKISKKLGAMIPANQIDHLVLRDYRQIGRKNMQKILDKCIRICGQKGFQATNLHIEMDSIEKGIVELISQNGIRKLVMGAGAGAGVAGKVKGLKSKKAMYVHEHAPVSCRIQFVCNGRLLQTREANLDAVDAEVALLPPRPSTDSEPALHHFRSFVRNDQDNRLSLSKPRSIFFDYVDLWETSPKVDKYGRSQSDVTQRAPSRIRLKMGAGIFDFVLRRNASGLLSYSCSPLVNLSVTHCDLQDSNLSSLRDRLSRLKILTFHPLVNLSVNHFYLQDSNLSSLRGRLSLLKSLEITNLSGEIMSSHTDLKEILSSVTVLLEGFNYTFRFYQPWYLEDANSKQKLMHETLPSPPKKVTLPHHLKRLFLYCSLFPFSYEFSKDDLIQLWIAEGFIRERQQERMEDTASEHFDSLEKKGFFVFSRCDFTMDFDLVPPTTTDHPSDFLYKVNPNKHSLLEDAISSCNYFRAVDGKLDGASKMIRHLSLIGEDIDGVASRILQDFKHLRTLHTFSCHGSSWKQVPRDLCFTLTFLRTINLSGTMISELPSSIGNVKSLRYIDASHTSIARLPESIDSLYNLQTIKLIGCLNLVQLPKGMRKLKNLRHIDFDIVRQLGSLPAHLGNLRKLQTLSAFLVGREDGCHVGELKNLNDLKGSLNISRLENVVSKEEAAEAALTDKKFLHRLELRWSNVLVGKSKLEEEILQCLQPHFGLKMLQIQRYGGSVLPTWISNRAFANLAAITLYRCRNCEFLPCMGQLPALESLSLIEINEVKCIDHQFLRDGPGQYAFPKLERLEIDTMLNLKEWKDMQEGDFPSLDKLIVDSCPGLVGLPPLACLPSLKHLELRRCMKLLCLPSDGLPPSLECFLLVECLELKEWCLRSEYWSKLCHISSIWFDHTEVKGIELDC